MDETFLSFGRKQPRIGQFDRLTVRMRNDGQVEAAATGGTLVGVMLRTEVRSFETALAPGETCLLYTDGVTEARGGPLGGDMFGEQRLADALTECVGMPAEAVVERILMLTTQWVHDDIAVAVTRGVGTPHEHQPATVIYSAELIHGSSDSSTEISVSWAAVLLLPAAGW